MRTRILAIALITVTGIAVGLRADDKLSSDDLNKLFEHGGASDDFKAQFWPKIIPIKPLEATPAIPKYLPKFGKYVASYTPSIQNSTNYPEMLRQLQDSRMPSLPPAEQESFKAEGEERTNDRTSLLSRSDKLDNEDETLYWEGQRLNQRATDLNAERDRINVDVAKFNKFCTGRSLPPGDLQYCQAERTRIEAWKVDLGKRIDSHNEEYYAWEDKFTPFYAAANALGQAIQTWEGQMANLIDRLKQALARLGQCEKLEREFENACKKARSCDGNTGCADLTSNSTNNNACAKAADDLNQQCHGGARQDLTERANAARSAAAVCLALFQKKCGHWKNPDEGLCTPERHRQLQDEVKANCGKTYRCGEEYVEFGDCKTLRERFDNANACYAARWQIMQECYEGGDQAHKDEANRVFSGAAICQGRINAECRNPSIFGRP